MKKFFLPLCLIALLAVPCFSQDSTRNFTDESISRLMPYKSLGISSLVTASSQTFRCLAQIARGPSGGGETISLFTDISLAQNYSYQSNDASLGIALAGQNDHLSLMVAMLMGYNVTHKKLVMGMRANLAYEWTQDRCLSLELDSKLLLGFSYQIGQANLEAQLVKITEPLTLGVSFRGLAFEQDSQNYNYDLISCIQVYYAVGQKRLSTWAGLSSLNKSLVLGGSVVL